MIFEKTFDIIIQAPVQIINEGKEATLAEIIPYLDMSMFWITAGVVALVYISIRKKTGVSLFNVISPKAKGGLNEGLRKLSERASGKQKQLHEKGIQERNHEAIKKEKEINGGRSNGNNEKLKGQNGADQRKDEQTNHSGSEVGSKDWRPKDEWF